MKKREEDEEEKKRGRTATTSVSLSCSLIYSTELFLIFFVNSTDSHSTTIAITTTTINGG